MTEKIEEIRMARSHTHTNRHKKREVIEKMWTLYDNDDNDAGSGNSSDGIRQIHICCALSRPLDRQKNHARD